MSEPMSKETLDFLRRYQGSGVNADLISEIDRCHAEIERLEKAVEGSESLRHTIMTSALDAKRTFTKRIADLEKVNERLAAAYHQVVDKSL